MDVLEADLRLEGIHNNRDTQWMPLKVAANNTLVSSGIIHLHNRDTIRTICVAFNGLVIARDDLPMQNFTTVYFKFPMVMLQRDQELTIFANFHRYDNETDHSRRRIHFPHKSIVFDNFFQQFKKVQDVMDQTINALKCVTSDIGQDIKDQID